MSVIDRFQPVDDVILCKKLSGPEKREGGSIYIPETARERQNVLYLYVLSVGPSVTKGRFCEGDRLMVKDFVNARLDDGNEVGFVREKDVLAVVPRDRQ